MAIHGSFWSIKEVYPLENKNKNEMKSDLRRQKAFDLSFTITTIILDVRKYQAKYFHCKDDMKYFSRDDIFLMLVI